MRHDRRSIAIVGNAPDPIDARDAIDARGCVIRINKAVGHGGPTGSRVDELVLVNSGGQMEEWLRERSIERAAVFAAAGAIRLPIHPRKIAWITPPLTAEEWGEAALDDYTDAARARFQGLGKRVRNFPPVHYPATVAALGNAPYRRDTPAPSTGLLVARWSIGLARRWGLTVHIHNFGFAGWSGHDFAAEQRWFETQAKAGLLVLHR